MFHSARQIISQIEGVGGEINAYTTKEETTFYAATLNKHVPQTLRLISEMILCPTFPKAETDKERMVIYDEIESYNDSPISHPLPTARVHGWRSTIAPSGWLCSVREIFLHLVLYAWQSWHLAVMSIHFRRTDS